MYVQKKVMINETLIAVCYVFNSYTVRLGKYRKM